MIRPNPAPVYDPIDLKLGIKSSLPSVKPTLALLFIMWEQTGQPAELEYCDQSGNGLVLKTDIESAILAEAQRLNATITAERLHAVVCDNLMLKSQLEALIVAFELVWKVAKIRFVGNRGNGAERTGGTRYPKKLWFTSNMDLLDSVMCSNRDAYEKTLFSWLGLDMTADPQSENDLIRFLTVISEGAFYKLVDGETDVIFNMESLYATILSHDEPVDISGDVEAKGPLRILKSALSENLFANLRTQNNSVSADDEERMQNYQSRVAVFHQLSVVPSTDTVVPNEPETEEYHEYTREELLAMENKQFIFSCLGIMAHHRLFNGYTVPLMENRERCAELFRHNNIHGIIYRRPAAVTDEEFREGMQDDAGRARYYSDTYRIDDEEYYVSSQWRPDREEARGPFVDWIFELLREIKFETGLVSSFERNRITFGAPGTGKSHRLNEDRKRLLENTSGSYERVTFHPEYTYSQFVGSYKPVTNDNGEIRYDFVPGPFMRVLVSALKSGRTDSPQPHLLLIEEINRAKVAAVFGDVFQLLDRADSGASEYEIHATEDIKKYLVSELGKATDIIRIPDNMFIWATMNSADQGVFPMDTAFKRRWNFEYIGIDENDAEVGGIVTLGHGDHAMDIEWNQLRRAINDTLAVDYNVNEDKLLGPYFLGQRVFAYGEDRRMLNPAKFIDAFKSKVIMYLYEDAAKPVRKRLFEGCDSSRYSSVCEAFDERGIEIFGTAFLEKYRSFEV